MTTDATVPGGEGCGPARDCNNNPTGRPQRSAEPWHEPGVLGRVTGDNESAPREARGAVPPDGDRVRRHGRKSLTTMDFSKHERSCNSISPLDDDAAVHAVLVADEDELRVLLREDRHVREALRWRPNDADAERARTLLAAARVERRRRRSAGAADRIRGWANRRAA